MKDLFTPSLLTSRRNTRDLPDRDHGRVRCDGFALVVMISFPLKPCVQYARQAHDGLYLFGAGTD